MWKWLRKRFVEGAIAGKLHLFSLKQNRFILIQFVTFIRALHVSAFLRHVNTKTLQGKIIYLCEVFDPLHSVCIFLCKVFVLPCLRMASVQAETCSTHVQAPNWIQNKPVLWHTSISTAYTHCLHWQTLQLPNCRLVAANTKQISWTNWHRMDTERILF